MAAQIVQRGPDLPVQARPYRTIGPFDADSIPAGLWLQHELKAGVWGLLSVEEGNIRFCWDDQRGGERLLSAGETILIPPAAPHHLEREGPVIIALTFCTIAENRRRLTRSPPLPCCAA
ncbi:DUF1971 domain-containing protein [Sphingopyxis sp. Geo48]|uniref:DUF1971 domain-containing protein n=1 Tax=Sphingopyxis sp. Geo48 TaxID=545241 RepID=UPI0024B756AD|nr:DUF1971 domain-containing protein [Sphingopyxis sp. Geo48]